MSDFANRLIAWQKVHGRHDLPWQNTQDPYAIWVSEIMLQQTQVAAVIGYYSKFMARFPSIAVLANASQEEVLQNWSGLGYYSRARNLHRSANIIMQHHGGVFPQAIEVVQTLPGIGRSTAAAIVSFAFNQIQTILDGNVKRVLARHFLIEGWTGQPKIEQQLWKVAESLLPKKDMAAYNQGLMDLGATICTRSKPKCYLCPHLDSCEAYLEQRVTELPTPKPRKNIPTKQTNMLILRHQHYILLEKRPNSGIWGGLLSLPETNNSENLTSYIQKKFLLSVIFEQKLPIFQHVFTHFKLEIQPIILNINAQNMTDLPHLDPLQHRWTPLEEAIIGAIPTPVRQILLTLMHQSGH